MKSTVELLNSKERAALALFFGTDAFTAFRRVAQLEIDGLAKDALGATTMDQVNFLKGRAAMAKELPLLIELIYKQSEKKSW